MIQKVHHIAQANIALGRAPLSDPVMSGFVEQLQYVNAVADRSTGFVWRFQTEEGDSTGVRVFDNPLIIFNMSVWESIEALYSYVFRSDHQRPLKSRRAWFTKIDRPHSVLWWVAVGERPTVTEAEQRLNLLRGQGPGPAAFTFAQLFDAEGNRIVRNSAMDQGCGV